VRIRRLVSTYLGSLSLGFANIFIVPLVFYFIIKKNIRGVMTPITGLIVFITIACAQLLTVTRAAIIANILSIGIFFVYFGKIKISTIFILIPIIAGILFNPISQKIYMQTISLSDPSSGGHIHALKTGMENIIAHPLGYGLGTGGYVGGVTGQGLAGESLYFTIAVERGIVGFILFCLMILFLLFYYNRNKKYLKSEPILEGLLYVIIVSTFGYAIASITTEHWQAFISSGIYWIYAGIGVQLIVNYKSKDRNLSK
jgi:O-antigen ligase